MAGLPKLPGYTFTDPTQQRFHLGHAFGYKNGYRVPKNNYSSIGDRVLDVDSVGHLTRVDSVRFDPSLTYGRSRSKAPAMFLPHYALYDKKCLTFKAFYKQSVPESPLEFYRVRIVNIIYFLEDDTITVMEPKVPNSGLEQGCLMKRAKIPKSELGDVWHWKDMAVGKDLCFYCIVFHTVDCDLFTREYMASQGLTMGDPEAMPPDPYTQDRIFKTTQHTRVTPALDDKLRRFLEYDGKILKFYALWDDRDSENGDINPYEVLYFLADDTVAVKEIHNRNDGRDPFPLLLRKTKLPKIWTQTPVDYPSIYLERSDNEVNEYYQPKDFRVGETIFILGRRMFLYDCDEFTRNYFRKVLCTEQHNAIDVLPKPKQPAKKQMPPHDGIGSLEDSLQNTFTVLPKPPRKDIMKQILNANKYLRYEMKFDFVHPEDEVRKFIFRYSLGDSTVNIYEPPISNSGIMGGKFLRNTMIIKPGSDPLDPDYYTPADFYIGAIITVFQQRFVITGADLFVYRYMQANIDKFPCEVIENMRNYMFVQGLLDEDLQDKVIENVEGQIKAERDAIGRDLEFNVTEMDKCRELLNISGGMDPEYEQKKRSELIQQYEDSLKHTYVVPPHGIKPVNEDCAYPVEIGTLRSPDCGDMGDSSQFTPKHIDTPEEALEKHYAAILERNKEICEHGVPPKCEVPPKIGEDICEPHSKREARSPLMVQPVVTPKGACRIKSVRFAEGPERCERDRFDLCDLRTPKVPCDCTNYHCKEVEHKQK